MAAIPATDACRSSNRTSFGSDIVFHIEILDKGFVLANFLSNVHECPAIAPANESLTA
jgi:hypothetical protein